MSGPVPATRLAFAPSSDREPRACKARLLKGEAGISELEMSAISFDAGLPSGCELVTQAE